MLDSYQNALGVFVDDGMHVVNGEVLRKLVDRGYPSIKAFSKDAGIGRTRLYAAQFKPTAELRKALLDLSRIYSNALKLFDTPEEAREWLLAPNPRFYNSSPFVMAMTKKGNRVYELQEELIGGSSNTSRVAGTP